MLVYKIKATAHNSCVRQTMVDLVERGDLSVLRHAISHLCGRNNGAAPLTIQFNAVQFNETFLCHTLFGKSKI